ncbi:hypothetical protein ASG17_13415 [Brevundimonas sp. Leaf363]|uniref:DUF952 domain-containing protein n=1 Tax=Brevundimonas sp. Leaf363 TaxID=1736353 RepID=UPI0006FB7B8C|nr:DUF952 domain-containing protein [Brevundimonas sp. Leaf363]KQS53948.1 hypothetical protein ASG17_13415 [Brevundimonas sp. Leaf363]
MSQVAYKILTADQWAAFRGAGTFAGAPIDLTDGYIHLSTEDQWRETAQKHFAGQSDLILAEVRLGDLGDVRWEPSRGGQLFPHLYGVLPMAAVGVVMAFDVDAAGGVSVLRAAS